MNDNNLIHASDEDYIFWRGYHCTNHSGNITVRKEAKNIVVSQLSNWNYRSVANIAKRLYDEHTSKFLIYVKDDESGNHLYKEVTKGECIEKLKTCVRGIYEKIIKSRRISPTSCMIDSNPNDITSSYTFDDMMNVPNIHGIDDIQEDEFAELLSDLSPHSLSSIKDNDLLGDPLLLEHLDVPQIPTLEQNGDEPTAKPTAKFTLGQRPSTH